MEVSEMARKGGQARAKKLTPLERLKSAEKAWKASAKARRKAIAKIDSDVTSMLRKAKQKKPVTQR